MRAAGGPPGAQGDRGNSQGKRNIGVGGRSLDASAVAEVIATAGEGLAAVWLEAEDLDQMVRALTAAGIAFSGPRLEDGRRILEVDYRAANMVALFIFDRRV